MLFKVTLNTIIPNPIFFNGLLIQFFFRIIFNKELSSLSAPHVTNIK